MVEDTAIYFIQAEKVELIKIGYAENVELRMKHLQAMSPVRLTLLLSMKGDKTDERILHGMFSPHRDHGEWFTSHVNIMSYIDTHKDKHPIRVQPENIFPTLSNKDNKRDEMIIEKLIELGAKDDYVDLYQLANATGRSYNTVYYWINGDKLKGTTGLKDRQDVKLKRISTGAKRRIVIKII